MNPISGTIIANRFRLVRELGRGTMGTVWLAQHLTLDVPCAVKFMTAEAAREPQYTARFALEARAIAQIQSSHIVRVLDYDLWNGVPFIAMERLLGEDLGARLQRVRELDAASTCRVVAQVARGLSRAHAAGIIHRDLKPENVFLAREDDDEVAKLVDFGIAKFNGRAGRRTQVGELLGTPAYMSPEQVRCAPTIDSRADLWSLGAIAFECLTGRLAFDGASLADIFARILVEPLPVPSHVAPELPEAFDAWFARAVSRDPDGRFGDAREMSDALERALDTDGTGRRSDRLELVTARTLRPGPRRGRSGWPLAVFGLAVGLLAVFVPSSIPPRFTHDLIHRFAPYLAPASASALGSSPGPALGSSPGPAPGSSPGPAPGSSPGPARVSALSSESAAAESRPTAFARSRVLPPRPLRAAAEPQPGRECLAGQRRCRGTTLQLCNVALDGWTDFIDCGESAVCDAVSGSGPCAPLVPLSAADANDSGAR